MDFIELRITVDGVEHTLYHNPDKEDIFPFGFDYSGNGFRRWQPDITTCIDHIRELNERGDETRFAPVLRFGVDGFMGHTETCACPTCKRGEEAEYQ